MVSATADQCGVLHVLLSGLLQDKIKMKKIYGYSKNALVQCAVQSFAFLTCPILNINKEYFDSIKEIVLSSK